jgi:hypothetical protein
MMTRKSVDAYTSRRPFQPFEVRMVDGQRFRFTSIEQFIVGRDDIAALTKWGVIVHFCLGLVTQTEPWDMAILWPEGLAALLFPATPTDTGA